MNILFIGDISGRSGRNGLKKILPDIKKEFDTDFVIANIENASGGVGVTPEHYQELQHLGIDCFTSGNHIWNKPDIIPIIENPHETLIRPLNFPPHTPGRGVWQSEIGTTKVAVVNVMGRVFMKEGLDDPFRALDNAIKDLPDHLIIVDVHAEVTSEKRALGFYADGRVAAVIGTHTHVPTADAQMLPGGTAYITDVGYVGPLDSIIGVDKQSVMHNFTRVPRVSHEVGKGDAEFGAVIMQSHGTKITSIEHIRRMVEL